MENKEFIDKIVNYVANSKDNFVSAEDAIYPNLAGIPVTVGMTSCKNRGANISCCERMKCRFIILFDDAYEYLL